MDLNTHLGNIVEGLVSDITANVLAKVDSVISGAINNRLANYDFAQHVQTAAAAAFEKRVSEYQINPKKLEDRITEKINATINEVQSNSSTLIVNAIETKLASADFEEIINKSLRPLIADRIRDHHFPKASISSESINFENKISGDCIEGGIIQHFSSTGIDDRATQVALTILDQATVVENNLLTKDLQVEGTVTINGNFVVNGNVPADSKFYQDLVTNSVDSTLSKLDSRLFNSYSDIIFNKLKIEGLDLNRITINGSDVIIDNQLGSKITESNLQKIGVLKELQVSGESLLSGTFYVSNKRVGINTIEPSSALSVWDDEVEIIFTKRQKDTGLVGTSRQQKLLLSANGQDNILLETDGSVRVKDLHIGTMKFTSAGAPPSYISTRGHVVWNNNPNPGGPMGWICLGGANWANFGIID